MRILAITVVAIAALATSVVWQSTDVSAAQRRQVRSYEYCWQLAFDRGWIRARRGEQRFIRDCMQGRVS
jgi:hypothetical protein